MLKLMSDWKIWDSERKTKSGWNEFKKYLREKTFLLRPSRFQVMDVRLVKAPVTTGLSAHISLNDFQVVRDSQN